MGFNKGAIEDWTDRKCFPYSDGTQDLKADPMEVLERMNAFADGDANKVRDAAWPEPEVLIVATKDPVTGEVGQGPKLNEDGETEMIVPPVPIEDKERFYAMVRYGFELAAFDKATGQGLTWAMLFQLWNDFQTWLEKKSQERVSLPISSAPTEGVSLPA